jgi:dUTP diphosphatase
VDSSDIEVLIRVLAHGEGLGLPAYASDGAAGCDLKAAIASELVVAPGERSILPTGIELAIPKGYEGQVRMRSGLAAGTGLYLPNAPGTIDSDYRGEVRVIVANGGREPIRIARGDRIAQLVIAPVARARFLAVEELPATDRGGGGFGSTGV